MRPSLESLEPRLALAGVVINEFLALNESGIADQDGELSDWVELYNMGDVAVDLSGWRLTDDATDLAKWTFPAITLPAGEHLLVYASNKDRAIAGQELHANFALSVAGEYLALVQPDGTIQDAYALYPEQRADVSYGRGATLFSEERLVDENHSVRALVPTASTEAPGLTWTAAGYDDASWLAGTAGVGYERSPGDAVNYTSYLELELDSQMPLGSNTAYLRFSFDAAEVDELANLALQMRYDDGFVAYLNGQEIARRNAPPSSAWNSTASDSHSDSEAVIYETFDVSDFSSALVDGANVLAVHGLNRNGSSDFLIAPLLIGARSVEADGVYMIEPTPGEANALGTLGFVDDTSFSVDRGFYEAPVDVLIATNTPGATIRYTLDGSVPTATTGLIYDPLNPPHVATTTILRAAAFKPGFTPTNVDTQTYIFAGDVLKQDGSGVPPHAPWGWAGPDWAMDPDVVNDPAYSANLVGDLLDIPSVSLVMPWNTWFGGGGEGIYISGSNVERQGSIEFFNAPGSDEFQIDGALEIQGGTSTNRWKTDKLSIRATFKQPFGPTKLEADVFTEAIVNAADDEFDTLIFDAQLNYTWTYGGGANPIDQRGRGNMIKDQYVADLQNLLGGQAPHGRFVHLYINGLYWGMYDMHERPDDGFAESYLGGDKDDYDVIKHQAATVVSGDAAAAANYAAMLNLVRQDLSVSANYAAAADAVDVDDLINYMLVNYYVGNTDWAHHNWYATHNRVEPTGKWRFHSWDAEHVLKGLHDNVTLAGNYTGSPEEVHLRMMSSEEYRLRFSDLVQKHMNNGGVLTPEAAAAAYQARVDETYRGIVAHSARWGDSHTTSNEPPGAGGAYTRNHWLATQDELLNNYFPDRTDVVRTHFAARDWLASAEAPLFSHYGGSLTDETLLTIQKPAAASASAILYYTIDGADPRAVGGRVAPTAIAAAGSSATVTVDESMRVRARIFDPSQPGTRNDWSPEIDAAFLLNTPFPLRITELHYNPASIAGIGDEQDLEFIELQNMGSDSISLDSVVLADFVAVPYAFAAGQTLGAGERIVVARNPAALQQAYGAEVRLAAGGYATGNLSNGGETVTLLGPSGQMLQHIVYDDENGWPAEPDGRGYSLEIVDPLGSASDPDNWRVSYYAGGSPGAAGDPPLIAGDFDGDGMVSGNDFLAWQRGVGTPALQASAEKGDANGDRHVDGDDLAIWSTHFGQSQVASTAAASQEQAAAIVATESNTNGAVDVDVRWQSWFVAFDPIENRSTEIPVRRHDVRDVDALFDASEHDLRSSRALTTLETLQLTLARDDLDEPSLEGNAAPMADLDALFSELDSRDDSWAAWSRMVR